MTYLEIIILVLGLTLILVFAFPPLRRHTLSAPLMNMVGKILPTMGDTERIALEAGTVWWDGELFSGRPDWSKLHNFKIQPLSQEEQDFIDGPLEDLCEMLDDWQITQDRDLPSEVWAHLKKHKFLGMIIPKAYGGLGFSAHAHSAIVTKISSRSVTAAVTVMVPNSLGPGELLLHYGTDKQREYYL
ncbi:MAG: acyl-CoA dehydrogenase family protein, partial [Alphaproteobacteria bacterium]|nr:acyl-CoA dehydrogenase family protein [Alphaproteobacteria bacterium]